MVPVAGGDCGDCGAYADEAGTAVRIGDYAGGRWRWARSELDG
jgi:hypothetical protein